MLYALYIYLADACSRDSFPDFLNLLLNYELEQPRRRREGSLAFTIP